MSSSLPEPRPNADSIDYWACAKQGRLVLRECTECGKKHFPPRRLCPACWSESLRWSDASGFGTVYTFTIMRRPPVPEFAAQVPYVVALIDLAEGPRMMANIVGDEAQAVRIGERVSVCFEQRAESAVPQFRRVGA
jgi:uncharacterized protein